MKVTPVSKTLSEVLKGNFIKIPRFQRPYDWDRDNITEFWNDLKDRSDPEYFMGSLVIFTDQKEKNLISLVDGQQRITTISMTLAILRNILSELAEDGPATAIHEMIESRDLDNKNRYVLEHDPADRYFQYRIQSRSPDTKLSPETPQQDNLQSAFRFLDSSIRNHLKNEFNGNKNKQVEYIKHLRDCLLQMHFISIELDNEDDAYLIFETLNTRGKDLRVSDLLKNHFMRLLPAKTKGADQPKTVWSDMISKLSSVTTSIDPDSFLLHFWLAQEASVSKASLFMHYKGAIKKSNAKAWLDDLKQASDTYVRCMAPTEVPWKKEQRSLQESIQALRIFGVAQAAPLMLAIMRLYENKIIALKATKAAFEMIEKFTFQFNALTQSRGGGGVSNMYAKLAQSATDCEEANDFNDVMADMREKFKERVPDEAEFVLPFMRLTYRSTYTRDRNLVRYALTKLARECGMPEEVDLSMLTIEHILPQSKGKESDDEFDVGAIGNLILINESINGELADKGFADKMKLMSAKNNVYLDKTLSDAKSWDGRAIGARGQALAKIGYSKIWKI
jgi:Protein of unknown function DUF262/Protein of unknown function (DUF1524)